MKNFLETIGQRRATAAEAYQRAIEVAVRCDDRESDRAGAALLAAATAAGIDDDTLQRDLTESARRYALDQFNDAARLGGVNVFAKRCKSAIGTVNANAARAHEDIDRRAGALSEPLTAIMHFTNNATATLAKPHDGSNPDTVKREIDKAEGQIAEARELGDGDELQAARLAWAALSNLSIAIANGAIDGDARRACELAREARAIADRFDVSAFAPDFGDEAVSVEDIERAAGIVSVAS